MGDFIETHVAESAHVPSPEIYRRWAAITAVSGALERKVWTRGSAALIYPNLFTVLVGQPGSGKDNAIRPIRDFWAKTQGLHISPDNVTKASLIDALSRAVRTVMNADSTECQIFSALSVAAPEFGVFFTKYDLEFLSTISSLWMSPPNYVEERRTSGTVEIAKPHLVMLSGTQPDFINSLLPEEAWGQGFAARLIMVYSPGAPLVDLFDSMEYDNSHLISKINEIFNLSGEFKWTDKAKNAMRLWHKDGCPPEPEHSRLSYYKTRRPVHCMKLCMISAASDSCQLLVTENDVERAKDWLIAAEKTMPDIFRAMGAKSDNQLIQDLHYFMYQKYSSVVRDKRKPISDEEVHQFLLTRATSERIGTIIAMAQKTGHISQGQYPGEWVPNEMAKHNFGNM